MYSLTELAEMADKCREKIFREAERKINREIIKEYLYFYNYAKVHKPEELQKMIAGIKTAGQSRIKQYVCRCWEDVLKENWSSLFFNTVFYVEEKFEYYTKNPNIIESEYDLRCMLILLPVKRKLLVTYFGNRDFQSIIEEILPVSDYHYQNQTDRPENISKSQWKTRAKDWEEAIGPDYTPINHGIVMELHKQNSYIPRIKQICATENLPTKEDLAEELFATYSIPGLDNNADVSEIMKYCRSEEYKKWKTEKMHWLTENIVINEAINCITDKEKKE